MTVIRGTKRHGPNRLGVSIAIVAAIGFVLFTCPAPAHPANGAEPAAGVPAAVPAVAESRVVAGRTLAGRVIVDPRSATVLAADQPGFLEAPPGGFPAPGSRVRAGQPLAYLHPVLSQPERRDLDADLAVAERDVKLGALQVKRFNANEADVFDGQLPLPSIQILGEHRSAMVREAQLKGALTQRVALLARADAVVVGAAARTGQAVSAGDTIFDLATPDTGVVEVLTVNALADPGSINRADIGNRERQVSLIAQSFDPALRAYRLLYAVDGSPAPDPGQRARLWVAP